MEGLAVRTPIPIDIREWIRLSCDSPSRYSIVKSAVNLACVLTKRILQISALSAEAKIEDHINPDNILILIQRPPLIAQGSTYTPSIMEVKFKFEAFSAVPPPSLPTQNDISATPSRASAVCAALGKVLLEIFSMGRSSPLQRSNGTENNGLESTQNSEVRLPAKKRQATSVGVLISSTIATNLLLELRLPLSICQLVCDLLDAGNESSSNQLSLTLVNDVYGDLTRMKTHPQAFLFDRTCPVKALADTVLFGSTREQLFGRDEEMKVLTMARTSVSKYAQNQDEHSNSCPAQGGNFLCETVFLRGQAAGSGKSSILHSLANVCNEEQWFVLGCKFVKHAAPDLTFAKAFDDFFAKWGAANSDTDSDLNPAMIKSFREVCTCILKTVDDEGFNQLRDLMPNFNIMFPILSWSSSREEDRISSMDKVGSANKKRNYVFHVLLEALCSTGRPVLLTFDDLQWSGSFILEGMTDFIVNYINIDGARSASGRTGRRGILMASAFLTNEATESNNFLERINCIQQSGRANVTNLTVGALSKVDVNRLVSTKLCLPLRHTRELAELVHRKTAKGNPFFVIQFLKSIIKNKILEFSVQYRQWMWDCDVVDMQMISNDVAKLLTTTFNKLPLPLIQTISIVSCLGSQVEESTIIALNLKILPFDMLHELEQAVNEGIMEKAGPMYQFTHDVMQQTIYDLTPSKNMMALHKSIGNSLLESGTNNPTIHLLAVDQINLFSKNGTLSSEECAKYAHANAAAAKFAIKSSSFETARSYTTAGTQLLSAEHWQTQYSLSLDLFETSASLSCMSGDVTEMASYLGEILSNARTFDDSLKASSLLIKLLASVSRYEEARDNCLVILSHYREVFPSDISLPCVLNELSTVRTVLGNISHHQVKLLPRMVDKDKLNAMKFLNMLCMYSIISKPMLLPLLSSRMVKITLAYGFCDDSIVGLATAGYSVFLFTDNLQLASHIGKVSESLVESSLSKHALRARLCLELIVTLKTITEPMHSVVALCPDMYNSAMIAGDVENAVICRWSYCSGGFWTGAFNLVPLSKNFILCIQEADKYQQNTVLYIMMSYFNSLSHLSGATSADVAIKSYDELDEIGERTNSCSLVWQTFMGRLSNHFWMREYLDMALLSEKYSASSQHKRIVEILRVFYEGIAYLSLARDTKRAKWRSMGEEAVTKMSQLESMSTWNYENKSTLLQAELLNLNGDIGLAEVAYKASIKSAHRHKFIHEEALAYELYGICCIENRRVGRGLRQLHLALKKYGLWGAKNKVDELQLFVDTFLATSLPPF